MSFAYFPSYWVGTRTSVPTGALSSDARSLSPLQGAHSPVEEPLMLGRKSHALEEGTTVS